MQATICTGQNRKASGVVWWGTTLRTIFLHPYQYSCWLASDPNRSKLLSVDATDPQFAIALGLASDALSGVLLDITNGADSYRVIGTPAKWANGLTPCATIGNQEYFKTIRTLTLHIFAMYIISHEKDTIRIVGEVYHNR